MIDVVGGIGSLLSILTVYWVTKREIRGVYVGIVSNVFWITFGAIGDFWYIVFSNVLFLYFGIRGINYWKDNKEKQDDSII